MPSTSLIVIPDGAGNEVSGRVTIESGRLQGLAVHTGAVLVIANQIWAEAGVELGGDQLPHRCAILCAGYVTANGSLPWDGDIQLEQGMNVYLRVWGLVTTPTFLGILTGGP